MILLSYINARGEEIVLDDTEHTFLGELYGREGTEAPALKYSEVLYGDGSTDIVVLKAEPRNVTFYFWAPAGTPDFRSRLEQIKQKLIQTGSRSGEWGRMKIRRPDDTLVYLNCVYTGGFDNLVREYPKVIKFSLTFRASDPLFHDESNTEYVIRPDDEGGYLYMRPLTFSGGTYDFAEDNITSNPGGLYFRPLTEPSIDKSTANPNSVYFKSAAAEADDNIVIDDQKVYPTITITGPAKNIRIINKATGKKLEFAASVETDGNNYILIETRPLHRKVQKINITTGAATNIIAKLTADSSLDFPLERGVNEILFRNSEATQESLCTFTYMKGYLSAE